MADATVADATVAVATCVMLLCCVLWVYVGREPVWPVLGGIRE